MKICVIKIFSEMTGVYMFIYYYSIKIINLKLNATSLWEILCGYERGQLH